MDPLLSGWESMPLRSTLNSASPSTSRSPSKVHSKDLRQTNEIFDQICAIAIAGSSHSLGLRAPVDGVTRSRKGDSELDG